MALTLPNLDDRTFADLMDEARALIPVHAPQWTNHNPASPGITVLEMFAHLAEMMIYRLNRVSHDNRRVFFKLLRGEEWQDPGVDSIAALERDLRDTIRMLRKRVRAVTCDDFEKLAKAAHSDVARARCRPRRNLDATDPSYRQQDKPGHMSVIIVPGDQGSESEPQPTQDLIDAVRGDLEPRRTLTTALHVVGPRYVGIGVRITLVPKRDYIPTQVQNAAVAALRRYLHPIDGGADARGWPFGRNVYVSEIYQLLDQLEGVDYVSKTPSSTTPDTFLDELIAHEGGSEGGTDRVKRNPAGDLVAIELYPDELVGARIDAGEIRVRVPNGY